MPAGLAVRRWRQLRLGLRRRRLRWLPWLRWRWWRRLGIRRRGRLRLGTAPAPATASRPTTAARPPRGRPRPPRAARARCPPRRAPAASRGAAGRPRVPSTAPAAGSPRATASPPSRLSPPCGASTSRRILMTARQFLYTLRCHAHRRPVARGARALIVARAIAKAEHIGGARRGGGGRRERRAGLGVADGPRRRGRDGAGAVEGVDRGHAADARASSTSTACARCRRRWRTGFVACSPEAVFPGAGGMPITDEDGVVIGGVAASGATVGPFVDYPAPTARKLIADGKPANCRGPARALRARPALRGPARRRRAALARGLRRAAGRAGARDADPPPAPRSPSTSGRSALADRAIAAARARGACASPSRSSTIAATRSSRTAWTARRPRGRSSPRRSRPPRRRSSCRARRSPPACAHVLPYRAAAVPGGLPRETSGGRGSAIGGAAARGCARDRRRGAGVRVCVVGCGAIGGLFAARLATQPGVEVWAYDVSRRARRRDQPRRAARRTTTVARVEARTDAREIPPCELRHRRHEGDAHRGRDRRDRARVRRRGGLQPAERDRQRGGDRAATSRASSAA